MQTVDLKKLLDKVGFGWMVTLPDRLPALDLSDIRPVILTGNFDLGCALGPYNRGRGGSRRITPIGELLHQFKYEHNSQAEDILASLACDFIKSEVSLRSYDTLITVPPSYRSRLFDQVSYLAEEVWRRTEIKWERNVLKRTRLTKPLKDVRGR